MSVNNNISILVPLSRIAKFLIYFNINFGTIVGFGCFLCLCDFFILFFILSTSSNFFFLSFLVGILWEKFKKWSNMSNSIYQALGHYYASQRVVDVNEVSATSNLDQEIANLTSLTQQISKTCMYPHPPAPPISLYPGLYQLQPWVVEPLLILMIQKHSCYVI